MHMEVLYNTVRGPLFGKRMTVSQSTGILRLVEAWDKYGYGLDTALAYILAISYHETGRRMQPVRETFATSDKQAIARLEAAWKAGKLTWVRTPYWRAGWFGRGDVQLTHEANYKGPLREAVLDEFGVDIYEDRDQVLRPDISAFILIEGVTKGETTKSDFTAHTLETFINENKTDYVNARKTVNPGETGSYAKIAGYAMEFEKGIRAAREAAGEEFKGPTPGVYDGRPNETVLNVQKKLRDLGYPEVGTPDGRWGSKTRAAVLAFRADNELPLRAEVEDDQFLAALLKASPRPVSTARAEATVSDLRREGSKTIQNADIIQGTGAIGVGVGGLKAVDSIMDSVDKYNTTIGKVAAALDPLMAMIQDNAMVILFAVGAFAVYYGLKIKKRRLAEHQSGENVSK